MSNLPAVQAIYAAFASGDVPSILARLAEDVEWEYGSADSGVPWLQKRRGPAEVANFFQSLAALEFRKFAPQAMFESGSTAIALIDIDFLVKATGRTIVEEHEAHIWTFDDAGRVSRFTHKADTLQHWRAFTGS